MGGCVSCTQSTEKGERIIMPIIQFLQDYRTVSRELSLLRRAIAAAPLTVDPESTPDARARRLQTRACRKTLQAQQEPLQGRWEQLNRRFEQLLEKYCATDGKRRTILRQYYAHGMTDREIGILLGLSPKTIHMHRQTWIHSIGEELP